MAIYLICGFVFLALFLFLFVGLYSLSKRKDPVLLRLKELKEAKEGTRG